MKNDRNLLLQIVVLFFVLFESCMTHSQQDKILIHGHRGCRGLLPENTLSAFAMATELGVDAIELDVVITADSVILVSHDPYMHHEICVHPDGSPISNEEEKSLNIYRMNLMEVKNFKCGVLPHPRFPAQKQLEQHKPTLAESVKYIQQLCAEKHLQEPIWNVEIKSEKEGDFIFHPDPKNYVSLFLIELDRLGIADNIIIQSFDARILEELHLQRQGLKLVLLSEDAEKLNAEKWGELSFKPYGFSPNYQLVSERTVELCKENGIELIVWTVNDSNDMRKMADLGVKQIITDYPDVAIELFNQNSWK